MIKLEPKINKRTTDLINIFISMKDECITNKQEIECICENNLITYKYIKDNKYLMRFQIIYQNGWKIEVSKYKDIYAYGKDIITNKLYNFKTDVELIRIIKTVDYFWSKETIN